MDKAWIETYLDFAWNYIDFLSKTTSNLLGPNLSLLFKEKKKKKRRESNPGPPGLSLSCQRPNHWATNAALRFSTGLKIHWY